MSTPTSGPPSATPTAPSSSGSRSSSLRIAWSGGTRAARPGSRERGSRRRRRPARSVAAPRRLPEALGRAQPVALPKPLQRGVERVVVDDADRDPPVAADIPRLPDERQLQRHLTLLPRELEGDPHRRTLAQDDEHRRPAPYLEDVLLGAERVILVRLGKRERER